MIEKIKNKIFTAKPSSRFKERLSELDARGSIEVQGISGSLLAFVIVRLFELRKCQIVLIVADEERAERLRDDCALLVGNENVQLVTSGGDHHGTMLDMTTPVAHIETLRALAESKACIVVASAEGIATRVPEPLLFKQRSLQLQAGTEYPFDALLSTLAEWGFERKDFVEGYGDVAVRGGIVDVFPLVGENPIRLEFWGDSVESIREFDALSQRSIRQLQSAYLVPGLSERRTTESASLFAYLKSDAVLFLDEPVLIQKEIDEFSMLGKEGMFSWTDIEQMASSFARVVHSSFDTSGKDNVIEFSAAPQPATNGNVKLLLQCMRELQTKEYEIIIACDTQDEQQRIKELLEEELTAPDKEENFEHQTPNSELRNSAFDIRYSLFSDTVHSGFIYPAARLALFTEHEIFGRLKRQGLAKHPRFKGFTQKELLQLRRGDFVVHIDYGIGKFAGLEKINVRGAEQEVLKVLYEDNDTLYVNLNYINRVQKYSSREGHVPVLTKLGTAQWDRLKARAKKRVKDIARELITLYAKRKREPGFAFTSDTHWQKEMEASFMYEDTPDQAQATRDVKNDMELLSPMDRLICGDVGFGKTEVAVRAAFKAVLSGKQVAVLVPTTILAQQHYNTFVDRLGRYSVRIEAMHRFKARNDQKTILGGLAEGRVDILIGTHRLLSKDVLFKDLGLLVIDEEQRFGVAAKEKLRRLRANVDTMTLTATPIPRTLHFSLMGARDLSIINTPPRNRRPIMTEIAQFDLKLIREAILREMRRGGQVYIVHDRVQTIEEIQRMLHEHIPEARFHIAHGQMKGHELERTMMAFLEKKYDVLICTKIIESGIDIPSVNTIVINRADRFGLAELYQLRGRVGRSNEQAYAYLMTPPLSVLPKQTLRRLQALQEFTELGSGFNLAMRDLEIRGAGNLLGAEQSGFIMEMGFEMYQRIVEEAVAELKTDEFAALFEGEQTVRRLQKADTSVDTDIEALIPDFYIESDAERLDIYRRLYKIEKTEEVQSLRLELRDRFGEYPEEVEHLCLSVELKLLAAQLGFRKVELLGNQLTLTLPPSEEQRFYDGESGHAAPFQSLMTRIQQLEQPRFHLTQLGKQLLLTARIENGTRPYSRLRASQSMLENLLKA